MIDEPILLEPSAAEADEWAEREHQRREGWLRGPTAEERAAWMRRERERRLAGLEAEPAPEASDRAGRAQRSLREAQLATEGAVSLVWKGLKAQGPVGLFREWSRRGLGVLVRAGHEWEAEFGQPSRGSHRRVPLDEDVP
jgi:hypothetical protein